MYWFWTACLAREHTYDIVDCSIFVFSMCFSISAFQRKNKYFDAKLKALKARNEYLLCLEATNSTVHKYFVDDLSDLMDCMDFGFHHCVTKALKMQTSAEDGRINSMQAGLDAINLVVSAMDSGVDKQRFLEFNHTAFMIPKKFEFQGQKDEVRIWVIFCLVLNTPH